MSSQGCGAQLLHSSTDCCDAPSLQPPLQLPTGCEHQRPNDPGPPQPCRLCSAQRGQCGLKARDKKRLYLQVSPLLCQRGRLFSWGGFIWGLLAAQQILVSVLAGLSAMGLRDLHLCLDVWFLRSSKQKDLCPFCIVGSEANIICACSAVS